MLSNSVQNYVGKQLNVGSRMLEWNQLLSLLNTGITLFSHVRHLWSQSEFKELNSQQKNDDASKFLNHAIEQYSAGAFGSALEYLNKTIKIIESANVKSVQKFKSNELFLAKLYFLKATILFSLDEIGEALEFAAKAVEEDPANVLANNLYAFMWLALDPPQHNNLASPFLNDSLKLNGKQIFANFYLALLNNDHSAMDRYIMKLSHVLSKMTEHEKINSGQSNDNDQELLNFKHSTPPICIPFMLRAWIENKIKNESNPCVLNAAIKQFMSALENQPKNITSQFSVMLNEILISALLRMIEIKKTAIFFDNYDQLILEAYALKEKALLVKNTFFLQEVSKHHNYYLQCDGKLGDVVLSKLFQKDTITKFLQDNPIPNEVCTLVGSLIAKWVAYGWAPGKQRSQDIKELTKEYSSADYVADFFKNYLQTEDFTDWLRILTSKNLNNDDCHSFIQIICKYLKIDMHVYVPSDEGIIRQLQLSQVHAEPLQNLKTGKPEAIHLLYDNNHQCTVLKPIKYPSQFYKLVALKYSYELLEMDKDNKFAKQVIGPGPKINADLEKNSDALVIDNNAATEQEPLPEIKRDSYCRII